VRLAFDPGLVVSRGKDSTGRVVRRRAADFSHSEPMLPPDFARITEAEDIIIFRKS
jgi:hypothetical protein